MVGKGVPKHLGGIFATEAKTLLSAEPSYLQKIRVRQRQRERKTGSSGLEPL